MKVYISIPITDHDYEKQKALADKVKRQFEEVGDEAITPFDVAPKKTNPIHTTWGATLRPFSNVTRFTSAKDTRIARVVAWNLLPL